MAGGMKHQPRSPTPYRKIDTLPYYAGAIVYSRLQDRAVLDNFADVEHGEGHSAGDEERAVGEVLAWVVLWVS